MKPRYGTRRAHDLAMSEAVRVRRRVLSSGKIENTLLPCSTDLARLWRLPVAYSAQHLDQHRARRLIRGPSAARSRSRSPRMGRVTWPVYVLTVRGFGQGIPP